MSLCDIAPHPRLLGGILTVRSQIFIFLLATAFLFLHICDGNEDAHLVFSSAETTVLFFEKNLDMPIHVAIADDHSSVRVGMKYIVYEWMPKSFVSLVDDMQGLLHLLMSKKPVDIIILDIDIPGGNNLQMIKTIRDIQSDARILMHSASDELVYALRYLDLGADGYLQKDSKESEIKAALDTVLHGKKYLSPGLKNSVLQSRLNLGSVTRANPLEDLSNRELEVCRLLAQGKGVTEVAETLFIHTSTVGTHKAKIFDKLGVRNVKELIDKFRLYEVT